MRFMCVDEPEIAYEGPGYYWKLKDAVLTPVRRLKNICIFRYRSRQTFLLTWTEDF